MKYVRTDFVDCQPVEVSREEVARKLGPSKVGVLNETENYVRETGKTYCLWSPSAYFEVSA